MSCPARSSTTAPSRTGTTASCASPKNRGMRIDLVYGNKAFAAAVQDSYVDREERKGKGASDHAPVVVDLTCSGPRRRARRRTGAPPRAPCRARGRHRGCHPGPYELPFSWPPGASGAAAGGTRHSPHRLRRGPGGGRRPAVRVLPAARPGGGRRGAPRRQPALPGGPGPTAATLARGPRGASLGGQRRGPVPRHGDRAHGPRAVWDVLPAGRPVVRLVSGRELDVVAAGLDWAVTGSPELSQRYGECRRRATAATRMSGSPSSSPSAAFCK